ncbi:type II toxin-antitoxin system VapC family toxin [Pseudonocardia sp.]|uniref:type II toxin-antitoxin system VapC family toxin n=1 Tax=Pseudonocardia sp. TaxID=60912 RepID=UPI0026152101|nr:type II toxin-antitoxin system VapC family toxin [Pseudonocardia sp.]
MTRFLFDTAVFLYARGREHEYRAPCRELVRLCQHGSLTGEASVELVQEYAHVLRRRGLDGAVVRDEALAVGSLCLLHDFGAPELRTALGLVATSTGLGIRDAVHAATALRRGIGVIVSPDRAFDGVGGLDRVDPLDAARLLATGPPAPREADRRPGAHIAPGPRIAPGRSASDR